MSHPHDQLFDSKHDSGSTGATTMREGPFLGHELPMPTHQRVRSDQRIEFKQPFAPDSHGLARKQRSIGVGEANSFATPLRFRNPVLPVGVEFS